MKKIFSKILIAILILGFLFAPVTPKIDIQNHFSLVKNEVFAEDIYYYIILAVDGIKSVEKTTLNLCQEARDENLKSGTSVKTPCLKATSRAEIDAKIAEIKTETTQQEITEINKTYDGVLGDNFFNCEASTIFTNCLVAGLYHVVFSLSAFLASLSARILDYFVFYALDSDSYKGDFVTLGWVLVRDISNILFIIALLYVAGKTVLGLNASNNKKIISMVILMALLINFSLFITKVVIDISNIVARVFYANIENVDQSGNQNVAGYSDADGTTGKSISVGLVAQFDPQKIFQNSGIPQLVDGTVGPFAIVLILSIILMFYMTYMFLSVAFVFIGRVAMLWILMIFSPLAFVSNTVPDFKIPKFNFREWKSELFNQSFLAPIFVFFLYLIISFGKLPVVSDVIDPNTLNNVGGTATNGTLNTFMKIFIPFIIIFTLVKIAKDTTIKMAGELASGMSKWGTILGGAALGLGAAGVGFAGRQIIGRGAAVLTRKNGAMEYAEQRVKYREALNHWEAGGRKGVKPTWNDHKNAYNATNPNNKLSESILTKLGGRINSAQLKTRAISHGAHEYEDIKKKAGLEGVAESNISAVEQKKMTEIFIKDKKSEIQSEIRSGNAKDHTGKAIEGESEFKANNRSNVSDTVLKAKAYGDTIYNKKTGKDELTDQGKKKVEDTLNIEYNKILETKTKEIGKEKFEHFKTESKEKLSIFDKAASKSTSSSYDMRDFKPDSKNTGIWSKTAIFLLAGIAASLRTGLKKTELNPGVGKGDILKDLSTTIGGAIAGMSKGFKLDLGGGGHSGGGGHNKGGHDDHGGGHGGGHH